MPERLTKEQAATVDKCARLVDGPATLSDRVRLTTEAERGSSDFTLAASSTAFSLRILDLLDANAALLDILERLHSVQDGCPLHKYNTVWVKAMEDAQAAFDRAGGGA